MGLKHEITTSSQSITLVLSGHIDENSDFRNIELKGANQLIIDLKDITHINSMGLKNWTLWVKKLPKYPAGICFRNCPFIIVNQMNVLDGFLPSGSIIESVEIPFHCDNCGNESIYTAKRNQDFYERTADSEAKVSMALTRKCVKCGADEHADIIEKKYFNFLSRR